jgi:hypothetical protein
LCVLIDTIAAGAVSPASFPKELHMKVNHSQLVAAGLVKPSRVIRVRDQRSERRVQRRKVARKVARKVDTARVNIVVEV